MSVTLDANVLLYASDEQSPLQARALEVIEEHAAGDRFLYLFWPVITGYLRLATHPSVFATPLPLERAISNVEGLLSRPKVRGPGEGEGFWTILRDVLEEGTARGNLVTDAHLVALMRHYGVRTILTRDRDFRRFDGIRVRDPFAG